LTLVISEPIQIDFSTVGLIDEDVQESARAVDWLGTLRRFTESWNE